MLVSVSDIPANLLATFTAESSTRSLSVPPVSTVNVSLLGNLIAVFVSPLCTILSGMFKSLVIVASPVVVIVNFATFPPLSLLYILKYAINS